MHYASYKLTHMVFVDSCSLDVGLCIPYVNRGQVFFISVLQYV